ncbi:sigma-70 family RNA polymerase sigma factor [Leifsonia shinshuensis]|uniref:RNA polymerase sigma factor (Sigma-70 family) n=1 Tax=Leifsonia shinshuensis TaxID=150026 RepID=A0A853D0H1_9MICO|nr:sigma-70 family RNA polymerase sigma factor [Leifsonia shinshuensis]NYJ25919.1 RNA polymerase sigma factor (sigma-70 family) [Leifsonia shinshuensis]
MTSYDSFSDVELIELVRGGDNAAFGALWERHNRAGAVVARSATSTADPEDVTAEAYAKILTAIRSGGGPTSAFRPYLFTTIRNIATSWGRSRRETPLEDADALEDPSFEEDAAVAALDRSLTARAFRSLPSRWQEVLWYSEVEEMAPKEIGPLLGMSASAVAALAYRAREGLRQAWIQAHLATVSADSEHRWTIDHLGAYARKKTSRRETDRIDAHLAECARCSIVAAEAEEVGSRLGLVLLPLVAGIGGATAYTAWLHAGTGSAAYALGPDGVAAPAGTATSGGSATASTSTRWALGVTAAAVAAAVTIGFVIGPGIAQSLFGRTAVPSAQGPVKEPAPPADPAPADPPPATTPAPAPAVPETPPPAPVAPAAPAAPVVSAPVAPVPVAPLPVVAPPAAQPTTPTAPTTPTTPTTPTLAAPVIAGVDTGSGLYAGLLAPIVSGTSAPRATVTLFDHGVKAAEVTADSAGAWISPELTSVRPDFSITATQTGTAGDVAGVTSPASPATAGTVTVPLVTASGGVGSVSVRVHGVPGTTVRVVADGHPSPYTYVLDSLGDGAGSYTSIIVGPRRIGAAYEDGQRHGLVADVPIVVQ